MLQQVKDLLHKPEPIVKSGPWHAVACTHLYLYTYIGGGAHTL